jgi:hypothetical protein
VAQQRLGIATGTILLPAMTKLAGFAGRVAGFFTRIEEKGSPLAKVLVFVASGFAVAAVGAAALGQAVVGVLGTVFIVQTLFGKGLPLALIAARGAVVGFFTSAAEAAWGLAVALAANPITWVVAGVAALAVGGYLLVKNWGTVKTWLGSFWAWLTTTASAAFDKVMKLFSWSPPSWLSTVAAIAAVAVPGAAPLAAVAGASGASPAARQPVKVEQHFHIHAAEHIDHKALAREMHRMSTEGLNRALSDAGSE